MTGLAVVVVVYGALIGVTAFRWNRRAPRVRRDLSNNERRRSG